MGSVASIVAAPESDAPAVVPESDPAAAAAAAPVADPRQTGENATKSGDHGDDESDKDNDGGAEDHGSDTYYDEEGNCDITRLLRAIKHKEADVQLINALAEVDKLPSSKFYATDSIDTYPNPGISVNGIPLFTPITTLEVVNQLVHAGALTDAPFGLKDQTLIDPAVRKTLQAQPNKVHMSNPNFNAFVQYIAEVACARMGVRGDVTASLHKLLVYRPGDHFAPHRDSPHEPGMFGTLCVQLPSVYQGGALSITHAGETARIDQSGAESVCLQYTAFYADCLHHVEPLTSGFRVVLTYNLVSRSVFEPDTQSVPPPHGQSVLGQRKRAYDTLTVAAQTWYNAAVDAEHKPFTSDETSTSDQEEQECVMMLALDHLYPARNLLLRPASTLTAPAGWQLIASALKGLDLERASALFDTFKNAGLDVVVGIGALQVAVSTPGEDYSFPVLMPSSVCIDAQGFSGSTFVRASNLYVSSKQLFSTRADFKGVANELAKSHSGGRALPPPASHMLCGGAMWNLPYHTLMAQTRATKPRRVRTNTVSVCCTFTRGDCKSQC